LINDTRVNSLKKIYFCNHLFFLANANFLTPYYNSFYPEEITGQDLDKLLALGWYRMHQTIFTSSHVGLEEVYRVHWLRYTLSEIGNHTSHRKIRKRNAHVHFTIEDFTAIRADHAELHQRYRDSIDFDGAWNIEECLFGEEGLQRNIYNTKCISVFDHGQLVAGGYFDIGDRAAASILHFFDPLYKRFSPGKFLMLLTIDYLKLNQFEFYYPGYVVEGNSKMNYKLFLGKETAQYFDPDTATWKYFQESILINRSANSD
jgi:arginine-tRNA-protein transferase